MFSSKHLEHNNITLSAVDHSWRSSESFYVSLSRRVLHFGPFLSIKEDLAHLKLKSSICRHFVLHSCTPICTKCQEYSLGLLKLPHNTLQSQLQSPYPVIMMRDLTRLAIEMTPNAHRKATIAELSHTCHAFRDRNRSLKSLGEHFPAELLEIITRACEDFYGLFIVKSRFRHDILPDDVSNRWCKVSH